MHNKSHASHSLQVKRNSRNAQSTYYQSSSDRRSHGRRRTNLERRKHKRRKSNERRSRGERRLTIRSSNHPAPADAWRLIGRLTRQVGTQGTQDTQVKVLRSYRLADHQDKPVIALHQWNPAELAGTTCAVGPFRNYASAAEFMAIYGVQQTHVFRLRAVYQHWFVDASPIEPYT